MAQIIEVPNYGQVEFPDDMSDEDIVNAIKKNAMGYKQSENKEPSLAAKAGQFISDALPKIDKRLSDIKAGGLGIVSGIADIGQTASIPVNKILDKVSPLQNGKTRREDMQSRIGSVFKDNADTESGAFKGGELLGNVLSTLPITGAAGNAVGKLNPMLGNAIKSGGMSLGGTTGSKLLDTSVRAAGGGVGGYLAAGSVNPEDANTGAAIGAALPVGVKLAGAVGSGLHSIAEPLYQGGVNNIIGKAIRNAAGNQADDALRNIMASNPLVDGSLPTTAMVAKNPGIAALERASVANNPVATNELSLRLAANNDARLKAITDIMPDKEAALALRDESTSGLYKTALESPIQVTEGIKKLFNRPSMKNAIQRAKNLASEADESVLIDGVDNISGKGAQYIKMALDDMINTANQSGISGNELRAIKDTRALYIKELESLRPEYLQANESYKALSEPITQADVIDGILSKAKNFRGDLTPSAFSRALSDNTAKSVTGRANSTIEGVLNKEQLDVLNKIKQDLLNQDFAQTAGRGVGSNTVQNLAYTNMLDKFGIPTGLRDFAPAGVVGNLLSKAGNVVYKNANERIASELADALLNPKTAAALMKKSAQLPSLNYIPPGLLPIILTSQRVQQ